VDRDGSFAGYIGSCIDVTDAMLAEKALADMSGKLIEAQEQERTWIARELHDDVNQRIAVLAFELETAKESLSDPGADVLEKLGKVGEELTALSKDVQALSHRLHSSKLDYLGIVATARGFCKEYSEQQKVRISFSVSGVIESLPRDVSLCLFRVLQEALQNGVKHSRANHFFVEIRGTPEEVRLTIVDHGVGFDPSTAALGSGLGMVSMRERMQLVKGEFCITSRVGEGVTVSTRVPLKGNNAAFLQKSAGS
jgi:signal transduction histidine kinase